MTDERMRTYSEAEEPVCPFSMNGNETFRSLSDEARRNVREQEEREARTREQCPEAYRLSTAGESELAWRYRAGKEHMNGEDAVRYIRETIQMTGHPEEYQGVYAGAVPEKTRKQTEKEKALAEEADAPRSLAATVRRQTAVVRGKAKDYLTDLWRSMPTWFTFEKTKIDRRKIPFSAFAAIAAVAVALMLIVSGSVMVNSAKGEIAALNREIKTATREVADLRSDLDRSADAMAIREMAQENGFVDEAFLKSAYLDLGAREGIEAFDEEEEARVGLNALMSAIAASR